jgi:hypothetical protein
MGDLPMIQGYIRTDRQTYAIGETIYVHFAIEVPASGQVEVQVVEGLPDGSSLVAFDQTINLGQEYEITGTAGTPVGPRTLTLYFLYKTQPVSVASTTFEVIGGLADIYVSRCWVSPTNPLQEDQVTFYASIGNSGGTDASNVEIDSYLDGSLFSTEQTSLPAGESGTWQSSSTWTAQDGSHTLRVVANADRSVQESDYSNDEASCTFFVSPRTVTATLTVTQTSTRTQTQLTTTTIVISTTTTRVYSTDTTVSTTVTGNPVTVTQTFTGTTTSTTYTTEVTETTVQGTSWLNPVTVTETLTGLTTSTVYSPTVTVTVTITAAQMISNPLLWMMLCAFAMMGAVIQLPNNGRLKRLSRCAGNLLPALFRWFTRHDVRRTLFAACLVSIVILSITLQASSQATASTVTMTQTLTSTEWTTITQSLTSTVYSTSTSTETSTLTRTNTLTSTFIPTVTIDTTRYITSTTTGTSTSTRTSTDLTTITPTTTLTVDHRITTTTYVPTYVTTTTSGGMIVIGVRVFCDVPQCTDGQPTKGVPFKIEIQLKNTDSIAHDAVLSLDASLPAQGRGNWQLNSQTAVSPSQYVHTFQAGESTTATFSLTGRWNWIDPDITNGLEIASLLASRFNPASLGVLIADYASLMVALAEIGKAAPKLVLTIVPSRSSNVPLSTRQAEVQVRFFNVLMLAISVALGGFSIGLDAVAVSNLVAGLIESAATGEPVPLLVPAAEFLSGALCYLLSVAAYQLAKGDPDQDYKTIATPINLTVPEIETLQDTETKRLGTETLGLVSYFNASLLSLARFFSAEEAGDSEYMAKQLDAAAGFMETSREKAQIIRQIGEQELSGSALNETTIEEGKAWLSKNGMPLFSKDAVDRIGGPESSRDFIQSFMSTPDTLIATGGKELLKTIDGHMQNFVNESRQETEKIRLQTGTPLPAWLPYTYVAIPLLLVAVGAYAIRRRRLIRQHRAEKSERSMSSSYPQSFCSHCGAEIASDAAVDHCTECGKPLRKR